MSSAAACCSHPHGRTVTIAAYTLAIAGVAVGAFSSGFVIGWLLSIFSAVVLIMTSCKKVSRGLLIAAGVCGIIAALCQFGMALVLGFLCTIAEVLVDGAGDVDAYDANLESYNNAIKALGGNESNYFIQAVTNATSSHTDQSIETDDDHELAFFCSFVHPMIVCGYVSGGVMIFASILSFCIPKASPVAQNENDTKEQEAVAVVTETPEQAAPGKGV